MDDQTCTIQGYCAKHGGYFGSCPSCRENREKGTNQKFEKVLFKLSEFDSNNLITVREVIDGG